MAGSRVLFAHFEVDNHKSLRHLLLRFSFSSQVSILFVADRVPSRLYAVRNENQQGNLPCMSRRIFEERGFVLRSLFRIRCFHHQATAPNRILIFHILIRGISKRALRREEGVFPLTQVISLSYRSVSTSHGCSIPMPLFQIVSALFFLSSLPIPRSSGLLLSVTFSVHVSVPLYTCLHACIPTSLFDVSQPSAFFVV